MIPWTDLIPHLCAIAADPADDTVRLALADRLDEEGGQDACRTCKGKGRKRRRKAAGVAAGTFTQWKRSYKNKCEGCDGRGWTPGVCARWAELVRVQVALAREGVEMVDGQPVSDAASFLRRASVLLPDLAPVLMREPCCERCGGSGEDPLIRNTTPPRDVSCIACHGHKGTGPLARLSPDAVTFRRGMPAVVRVDRLEQVWQHGNPTDWAEDIIRAWPVQEIVAADRRAWQIGSGRWTTEGGYGDDGVYQEMLGEKLFVEYVRQIGNEERANSAELATTALATAIATLTHAAVWQKTEATA